MKAAMNGFLWGPFGLVFVLLAKQRFCCPTCGKRTLDRRIEVDMTHIPEAFPEGAPSIPGMTTPPKLALRAPRPPLVPVPAVRQETAMDPEEQQLLAWVNGGQPTTL